MIDELKDRAPWDRLTIAGAPSETVRGNHDADGGDDEGYENGKRRHACETSHGV